MNAKKQKSFKLTLGTNDESKDLDEIAFKMETLLNQSRDLNVRFHIEELK